MYTGLSGNKVLAFESISRFDINTEVLICGYGAANQQLRSENS
ncbi:MAG: hypothetical protein QNK36_00805 [Colwellia sp.]|nr:hypothetical protein [Colwellia sp.]